ncbi:hypothetical protein ASG63_04215 [Methylobacterium sp. Leaf94]|uniref:DUF2336 domain-containing protein n=1 Tax=Methylobacterium sp. Leaf94 TaxID=1736250 RepID=UPI0006F7B11A|nr:DUF2336 domain-containing protein [Methylobacterium sp. Leaf94]KQU23837.1 hypothetical protein ASG63_04215 [Methylobacterium sp. Leaf94]
MIETLMRDIEQVVRSGGLLQRGRVLQRLSMLFTERAAGLREAQVEVFDAAMLPLARAVDGAARVLLADGLADVRNAPRAVVRDLAFDPDIAVARPVLQRSPLLDEADLVTVSESRGQEHLRAVAQRPTLGERVTDVLVARGDRQTVHVVAGNAGAQFSGAAYTTLGERARGDAVLRAMLVTRAAPRGQPAALAAGLRGSQTLPRATDADERRIDDLVRAGDLDTALAEVARLAAVSPAFARRAYDAVDHDPLLFLLRSIRLGFGTLKLFLRTKSGPVRPPEAWTGIQSAFQALSVTTAQRVVRLSAQAGGAPDARDPSGPGR